jgi:hypothetical protein
MFENNVIISDKISIIINKFLNTVYANLGLNFAFVNDGKKLCVKAPSAKIRLNRLGNLKATKNISEYIFAPRIEALNKSRIKPKILELNIPRIFIIIFLNINRILSKKDEVGTV